MEKLKKLQNPKYLPEIRITNPDPKLLAELKRLAKENKRSLTRQCEYMLEELVNKMSLINKV